MPSPGTRGPAGLSRVIGGVTGLDKHAASLRQTDRPRTATGYVSVPCGPVFACLRSHMGWGVGAGSAVISQGARHGDRTGSGQPGPTVPQNISQSGRQAAVPKPLLEPRAPLPPDRRALTFTNTESVLLGPGTFPCTHPSVTCAGSMPTSVPPLCPRVLGSR